jgi:hypothetical protein
MDKLRPRGRNSPSSQGERVGTEGGRGQGDDLVRADGPMSARTHSRVCADAPMSARTRVRPRGRRGASARTLQCVQVTDDPAAIVRTSVHYRPRDNPAFDSSSGK